MNFKEKRTLKKGFKALKALEALNKHAFDKEMRDLFSKENLKNQKGSLSQTEDNDIIYRTTCHFLINDEGLIKGSLKGDPEDMKIIIIAMLSRLDRETESPHGTALKEIQEMLEHTEITEMDLPKGFQIK